VLGRLDDMVVTGGVNVPAPAVARRLRLHPSVRDVEVLGVPDTEWGMRVVAFVVGDLDLAAARAWVAEEHPRSWAPRQLVPLETLPLLANGKVDRVQLTTAAASS
jgi:O-succinylbenzoic acid--CoA ligase